MNPNMVILLQNLRGTMYMIQTSSEFVVREFWRWTQCKTLLASGICDFALTLFRKRTCYGCTARKTRKTSILAQKCDFWAKNAWFSRFWAVHPYHVLFMNKLDAKSYIPLASKVLDWFHLQNPLTAYSEDVWIIYIIPLRFCYKITIFGFFDWNCSSRHP